MSDDNTLLRQFATTGSEAAFAEVVRRHVDIVYAAALRQAGGRTGLAADIAQAVFTALARKARTLSCDVVLVAWLHRATRLEAAATMRAEARRARREQHAALMQELDRFEPASDWDALCLVLDAALDDLNDHDREALLLRFFRQHSLREVGLCFNVSEDAARMRVERALNKLRELLAKRGVTSTVATITALLAGPAIVVAPASLAASICGVALASAATAGSTSNLGIMKLMVTTKLKLGLAALVAGGVATTLILQNQSNEKLRAEVMALRAQSNERKAALAGDQTAANADADELAKLRAEHTELLRLRGEVGHLRREMLAISKPNLQKMQLPSSDATPTKAPMVAFGMELEDRGATFPEHAASSMIWAAREGRQSRISELLELPKSVADEDTSKHYEFFTKQLSNVFSGMEFTSIENITTNSDGTLRLNLHYRDTVTGKTNPFPFMMRHYDSGWKVVVEGEVPKNF